MINLKVLEIIIDNIKLRDNYLKNTINIDDIYNFFYKVSANNNKFNNAYIIYYLYNNISSEIVSKRKTSSRDFEDVIATIFNGSITDESKRDNSNKDSFYLENDTITNFAISNKREKTDIVFNKNYFLSVKTLLNSNKEVNFGSFEKITLFSNFNVESYLYERKGTNSENLGLGSKPRLLNLLNRIKDNGSYLKFQNRFNKLVEFIFSDDLIILIKNKNSIDIYLIKGKDFINLLKSYSESPEKLISIVNRWEGNSIRINREPILSIGKKININFEFLDTHIIKRISEVELKISKYFIEYVNKYPNNKVYRDLIFKECSIILDEIDSNINILI